MTSQVIVASLWVPGSFTRYAPSRGRSYSTSWASRIAARSTARTLSGGYGHRAFGEGAFVHVEETVDRAVPAERRRVADRALRHAAHAAGGGADGGPGAGGAGRGVA